MNTPNTETHYEAFTCSRDYAKTSVQFTVRQGGKGEEKKAVNITLHYVPMQRDFPGGENWVDADGNSVPNPFYMDWLKYQKDHRIASERRDGETEFFALWRKIAERGPVTRKAETVAKEMAEKMESDPETMLAAMAQRLATRKGIPYAEALAKVKEDWA